MFFLMGVLCQMTHVLVTMMAKGLIDGRPHLGTDKKYRHTAA